MDENTTNSKDSFPWADEEAAAAGYSSDWRAEGYDSPEYMVSEDSIYHVRDDNDRPTGTLKCIWPDCRYRRKDVREMFRHVHSPGRHIFRTVRPDSSPS